jgi:hypothetical protein
MESLSVLTVAGAFFLLGIAGSPLAWAAILRKQSRSHQTLEKRWNELAAEIHRLEALLAQSDSPGRRSRQSSEGGTAGAVANLRPVPHRVFPADWPRRHEIGAVEPVEGPSLIAVPNMAATPQERETLVNGLTQRYAAIWALADQGASAEVIARATGQPIGRIELILGLRRQIDGTRTSIPHAPHNGARVTE